MKNMQNIIREFANIKGNKFVSIRNYKNTYGEVSNYLINVGVSVMGAKEKDYNILAGVNEDYLLQVSKETGVNIETVKKGYSELLESAKKNLSPDLSQRTKNSQARTNAFTTITKGVSVNFNTREFYVEGFVVQKKVLIPGTYPERKKRDKTIAKDFIKKDLDFRMLKYRSYFLKEIKEVRMNGTELVIEI